MGRFRRLRSTINYFSFKINLYKITFEKSDIGIEGLYDDGTTGRKVATIDIRPIRCSLATKDERDRTIHREGSTIRQSLELGISHALPFYDPVSPEFGNDPFENFIRYRGLWYKMIGDRDLQIDDYFLYPFAAERAVPPYLKEINV